jgi:hypothetical protein
MAKKAGHYCCGAYRVRQRSEEAFQFHSLKAAAADCALFANNR